MPLLILVAALASPPLELVALPLRAPGDAPIAKTLDSLLLSVVEKDGRFVKVIAGSDLSERLELQQVRLAVGCEDAQCLAELGKAIDVPYLLSADLGRLAGEWVFNLRIMAIGEARVLARAGAITSEANLAGVVREETRKLLQRFFTEVAAAAQPVSRASTKQLQDIAVLDLVAVHGVKASMAQVLNDLLLARLASARRFGNIIAGRDLRDLLDFEAQKATLGCQDDGCLEALGGALGVPLMAVPSVGRVGEEFILNLKVMQVEDVRVLARTSVSVKRVDELPGAVILLAERNLNALFGANAHLSAEQLQSLQLRRIMRGSAGTLSLLSTVTTLWSVADLNSAQSLHSDSSFGGTSATFDGLVEARDRAVMLRWTALGAAASAVGLWLAAPSLP